MDDKNGNKICKLKVRERNNACISVDVAAVESVGLKIPSDYENNDEILLGSICGTFNSNTQRLISKENRTYNF